MEWQIIALNVVYAIVGVLLMSGSYRVIDRLTPEVNFPEELRKGNIAVAIVVASILVSIAMTIGGALR